MTGDELVREARERHATGGVAVHTRVLLGALGVAAGVGITASAIWLHGGLAFSWWRFALFAALYALVSRVEFEIGHGAAIPTQLVLVPMLFALPIGLVPLAVAAGLCLRTLPDRPWPLRRPVGALSQLAAAAHALGPALVLGLAGGLPLRYGAWPVYVAALAAQIATDFANAAANGAVTGVDVRVVARFASLAYAVDCALAPVGLLLAVATHDHPVLVVLALPLVGLLRYFSQERRQRIDSALELSDAYRGTAFLLGDVVEADDAYTGSHSRHVVDLVLGVSDELGLSPEDRRDAEFVALLHDVGKIRIPSEIINKPGALNDEERAIIETHTIEGEKLLEQVGGLIGHVGTLVRSCHERWDGAGYPDGLAGEEIPLIARIVCACDAYSAMTTDRPYRKARTPEEALAEMQRSSGTHFDPAVVEAIVRLEA
ncbi:MAG TPA: HD-GYP domain-containing protein [Gaiellaceae bacterium]|nr:HD-GYP domain-containing protein [Gaiellaceae bacterium]